RLLWTVPFILISICGHVTALEGGLVTLRCNNTTAPKTSSNNIYLYWYQQYPNQAPQDLLYKVTLADTALYYCSLKDAQ
uniref:Ig-like domain-containing protein n=1 Tax=Hucho hucho TaxID=62062 RepID=A0A4W5L2H8_9TELE